MFHLRARAQLLLVVGLALVPSLAGAGSAAAQPSALPGPMSSALSVPASVAGSALADQPVRGCGSGQQSVAAPAIAELPRVEVGIYDGFFLPAEVTIPRGSIVVWTNHGTSAHTTTAWDRWDSGVLRPGESCEAWFVTPGTYSYLSIAAADGGVMTGSVSVDAAAIGSRPNPADAAAVVDAR
jgi:plastocyanin